MKVKLQEFHLAINADLNARKQKPLIHYKTPDTFIYYPELDHLALVVPCNKKIIAEYNIFASRDAV